MTWTLVYTKQAHKDAQVILRGAYSRRINIQHRLVYQVLEDERVVKVLRLWSHYE
ncbi:type II toxin-antitoxin system YoeB family toxin [Halomonas sp. 707B3]|nr:type II toxin-antitoxin system YoeB family toxin [Halomonas lionensis]MCP1318391.1 type II toxin-antitoxin system YoeB family toxin [Halomonas sp. 707B3]